MAPSNMTPPTVSKTTQVTTVEMTILQYAEKTPPLFKCDRLPEKVAVHENLEYKFYTQLVA